MTPLPPHASGYVLHEHYRILRRIGGGGFGQVYQALDTWHGVFVAVKESTDPRPDAPQRLLDEIALLARLDHPGLPKLLDRFAEPDGRFYLVMTFIPGLNLREIRCAGPVTATQAVGWLVMLCEVLNYLHHDADRAARCPRPIIHQDVKPENLIPQSPFPRLVLVDLGIAGYAGQVAKGISRCYAPPEQYQAHRGGEPTLDVFAAGATLLYLLTGEDPPDWELNAWERRRAAQIAQATDDAALRAVLTTATATRPEQRYPTAAAMRAALLSIQAQNRIEI